MPNFFLQNNNVESISSFIFPVNLKPVDLNLSMQKSSSQDISLGCGEGRKISGLKPSVWIHQWKG